MSENRPSRTADKFVIRFPEHMRDNIADRAKRNGRSMNAEIVEMLSMVLLATDDLNRRALDGERWHLEHQISYDAAHFADEVRRLGDVYTRLGLEDEDGRLERAQSAVEALRSVREAFIGGSGGLAEGIEQDA